MNVVRPDFQSIDFYSVDFGWGDALIVCGHRNGGATNAAQHVAECHAYEIKYGDDDE